jgi:hypothetical protein
MKMKYELGLVVTNGKREAVILWENGYEEFGPTAESLLKSPLLRPENLMPIVVTEVR